MRLFFIFFIFFFTQHAIPALAQDQCELALGQAENKYRLGKLYEIPELLQPCINSGFTKEAKIRAYRLLTLTYLFLDYYDEADKAYLELLKLSPEYKTNQELDPMEIINHSAKFTTKPKFYLSLAKVGINYSFANVLLDYSISQSTDGTKMYSELLGYQAGIGGEMVIWQNLHLSTELFLRRSTLNLRDTHWGFYETSMDISHTKVELPIMLKYNFFKGKVNPFVSAGISPQLLVKSAMLNIEGSYEQLGEKFPVQPRPKINTTDLKNKFNYVALLGGGINYKIGLNYLVFELRYGMGMLNETAEKKKMLDDTPEVRELKFPSGNIDDAFKINDLSFFVGFVKPLYKPRKIK
ncbi:MAG: PorT family protein [Cyclobacteriaceae bacterium]|nr:PorT family protein [Cyclobacteriaceae bacterium]